MDSEEVQTLMIDEWMLRQRIPAGPGPFPVMLLLHGWSGDENVMWIFATRLPKNMILLAPRGLYTTALGGYGWHAPISKAWPWVDDFQPAMKALLELITPAHFPLADFSNLRLVGFSQGAALAFSLALQHPEAIYSMAGLSGFLPDGAETLISSQPLLNKPIFMAHGTKDELVPVERARQGVRLLQQAGAQVNYCEDEVGHKLSVSCFRSMQIFFERY